MAGAIPMVGAMPMAGAIPMVGGVPQADEKVPLLLTMFVKTRMPRGFCCLGIDGMGRVKRPIYRQALSWDWNLELTVGRRYQFPLTHENIQTELPHSNEDVVVGPEIILLDEQPFDLYAALYPLATEFTALLFGGHMREGKYVVPGTNCPSVGVLKVNSGDVGHCVNFHGKTRVNIAIKQLYDLPYTGSEELELHDRDALVVLGLARPYTIENIPARCYILVLRIVKN